jgi:hypothetical protein
MKAAQQSEGYNEIAVGTSGELFVKDSKNSISRMSVQDYKKKQGDYRALTVAELLKERDLNEGFYGQNFVFDVAANSIGINKVYEYISDVISKFGEETFEDTKTVSKKDALEKLKSYTGKAATAEEARAIQKLYEIATSPGDYQEVVSKVSSERNQVDKALQYIWSTLKDSSKQKLTVTSQLNGYKNPQEMI